MKPIKLLFRIIFIVGSLVLAAWITKKVQAYHGDWEALVNDLQKIAVPLMDFLQKEVTPVIEKLTGALKGGA